MNLSIRFHIKELGCLKHFLGLEIEHTTDGIFLSQQKYCRDLLQKIGMVDCKPISTPMEPNSRICAHEDKDLESAKMYQILVGSLIYLTLSRPDISYVVGVLSRYMNKPKKPHLEAVEGSLDTLKARLTMAYFTRKVASVS